MTSPAMIVSADPAIVDDLLRLAAAANAPVEVARAVDHARPSWHSPSLILVGADLAKDLAATPFQRRSGVVLVAPSTDTEEVYKLAVQIGAQELAELPRDEAWLIDALATAAEPTQGCGTTICLTGSAGGAGVSVLAAGLGLSAARQGLRTLLIDGDPLGAGLDLVLGLEHHDGARWPDFAERRGRLSTATLREALPSLGDLSVLSWQRKEPVPVSEEAILSLIDAAVRGYDLVLVDVPRYVGELGRTALRVADATFLLVPAEVRSTMAAELLASMLRQDTADLRLIVRGPAPGGLTTSVIAEALNLPLAGMVERDRRLPSALDQGDFVRATRRGPLPDFCAGLLYDLGLQPHERTAEEAA
ncbi:septum site-determining protein Ssd [Spirillospora sp. NPDC048911]|uniref:septum site-determining protein Ssd n=1 Tax=Spirillospora sp. NPDC048911 TaxID=3364527 RepID=UPI00371A00E7